MQEWMDGNLGISFLIAKPSRTGPAPAEPLDRGRSVQSGQVKLLLQGKNFPCSSKLGQRGEILLNFTASYSLFTNIIVLLLITC